MSGAAGIASAQAPGLAGEDGLARPVKVSDYVSGFNPLQGFRFGIGTQYVSAQSETLNAELTDGVPFSDGTYISFELVMGSLRLAVGRRIYRHELLDEPLLEGQAVNFVGFESNQIWSYYGISPIPSLYLGAGLGWITRRYSFTTVNEVGDIEISETLLASGVIVDYGISLPFTLQLRWTQDEPDGLFVVSGLTLGIAYHAPF